MKALRPIGRPPNEVCRSYASFTYQAGSWSKQRRVIDHDATLGHHLLKVAVADAVFAIPAYADQNDVGRETAAFEVGHGGCLGEKTPVSPSDVNECNNAQKGAYIQLMKITDQKIVSLRKKVDAAHQEFDMAVTFHEVWKPAAFDSDLHRRMGTSYAANAFFVVRTALRREMLLALMRLWDNNARAIGMDSIAATLRDKRVINALAADRVVRRRLPEAEGQMRKDLGQLADAAITLIDKYSKGGSHEAVRRKLKRLRNERLAHRQTEATALAEPDATAIEIESFYQDMSELIGLLLSLVIAMAYNPADTGHVYCHHANFFWASVCGERTEGHPNYRTPSVTHNS